MVCFQPGHYYLAVVNFEGIEGENKVLEDCHSHWYPTGQGKAGIVIFVQFVVY